MTEHEEGCRVAVWEALSIRVSEGFPTTEKDVAGSLEWSYGHDETRAALRALEAAGIARRDEGGEWYVTVEGEDWDGKLDDE